MHYSLPGLKFDYFVIKLMFYCSIIHYLFKLFQHEVSSRLNLKNHIPSSEARIGMILQSSASVVFDLIFTRAERVLRRGPTSQSCNAAIAAQEGNYYYYNVTV
jgi:hypothetical protein